MSTLIEQAKKHLGQLFIIGFEGLDLSEDTSVFFSQANIGGAILFAQNFESPAQVAELINQVQECRTEAPLWISVDHEGGRVQRFKKGFTRIPEAAAIAATGSPKLAYEVSEVMAMELKAVGVNLNFAPVADINTNPKNPVIGARAFGDNEDQVTRMSSAMVRGHITQGVQACVKHFPGHGDTHLDSHFALPTVDTPLETLRAREFVPFIKAFKSRCNFVMTAHIIMTALDKDRPATFSSKILRDLLRKEIQYSKLIVSDDMEMKAVTDHFGAADAPRLAIEAGCDLLIYRSEAGGRAAYASLMRALDDGKLDPAIVLEAANRSLEIKKDNLLPYKPVVVSEVGAKTGTATHQAIVDKITKTP